MAANTEALLTTSLRIANYIHGLYDVKVDPNSKSWYHDHFIGGVNPYYDQTDGCLIIEESYGMPASKIHTPLGSWEISGGGSGSHSIIRDLLHKNVGLEMICPGYQTSMGFYGPYWLVTSFDNVQVPHKDIPLLPPHDDIKAETGSFQDIYLSEEALNYKRNKEAENGKTLKKYLDQLNQFYKKRIDYTKYENANKEFDDYLGKWIKSGLLADKDGLAAKMVSSPEIFSELLPQFLDKVSPKSREFVNEGTPNDIIFKLIYYSQKH